MALGSPVPIQLVYDSSNGDYLTTLSPSTPPEYGGFGASAAVDDGIAIVGSTTGGYLNGAAYLFDAVTGQQLDVLTPDGSGFDRYRFGYSVDLGGNLALIGAPGDDDNGEASGSAYLFDVTTGEQVHKLIANDGLPGSFFGSAVAFAGQYALIGASGQGSSSGPEGGVYVFDTISGEQLAKITPNGNSPLLGFGESISAEGNTFVVGASGAFDPRGIRSGGAYVYRIIPEPASAAIIGFALVIRAASTRRRH
ncbi:FG-GAP repeat protein [Botrimarina mediterranea]|nr:FG-GAP repeat protein [Botrimarina mediterranea]